MLADGVNMLKWWVGAFYAAHDDMHKPSTKNMKHINVRYYFIKDLVETGEVVINNCPTEEILGDHFTKPLQGALFSNFRAEIM